MRPKAFENGSFSRCVNLSLFLFFFFCKIGLSIRYMVYYVNTKYEIQIRQGMFPSLYTCLHLRRYNSNIVTSHLDRRDVTGYSSIATLANVLR